MQTDTGSRAVCLPEQSLRMKCSRWDDVVGSEDVTKNIRTIATRTECACLGAGVACKTTARETI